jgi:hypothetical protein
MNVSFALYAASQSSGAISMLTAAERASAVIAMNVQWLSADAHTLHAL